MALSRNARRRNAKLRVARRETDAANSKAVLTRRATVNANLSRPLNKRTLERTATGLVSSLYLGTAKSVGFTRRDTSSRGKAPLSVPSRKDWAVRGNQLRD